MYTLYNEEIDKCLTHPKIGIWNTPDLKEAQEMKKACLECMTSMNLPQSAKDKIHILNTETHKKVS